MQKWYVLHVCTGKEEQISKKLNDRGFQTVVPIENRVIRQKGKWIQQPYIVFTGYVFILMDYSWNKYYAMSGIDGIIKILGGGQQPVALSEDETKFILYLATKLEIPSVIKFTDNDNYKIVSGFLLDYEDKITKINRRQKKATVCVSVAGEEKEFKVSFVEEEQIPVQKED